MTHVSPENMVVGKTYRYSPMSFGIELVIYSSKQRTKVVGYIHKGDHFLVLEQPKSWEDHVDTWILGPDFTGNLGLSRLQKLKLEEIALES